MGALMKIYGFHPLVRGYGPRIAAAVEAARKNVDGTLDGRTAIAKELKAELTPLTKPRRWPRHNEGAVAEISARPYPKALRPTHVFREDGGHMPYETWMGKIPYADAIVGMMFEDGHTVGKVP
jgi:hypothetical protein